MIHAETPDGLPITETTPADTLSTATEPVTPTPRRTWIPLFGLSSYALSIPISLARVLLESEPGQRAAHRLGTAFDTLVTLVLERLLTNPALQSFIQAIIEQQLKRLGDDEAVTDLVQIQAERIIVKFTQDPTLLHPLVLAVADTYVESLRDDPFLVNGLVRRVAADYLTFLSTQPEMVQGLAQSVADDYLAHLQAHPEIMDPLVKQAAFDLLMQMHAEPTELHALVEVVGDRYIAYLRTNPEGVRALLQGQKETLTTEIIGEVRDRSAGADQTLENIVRSLLGGRIRRGQGPDPDGLTSG